jgi:hypothetical protein
MQTMQIRCHFGRGTLSLVVFHCAVLKQDEIARWVAVDFPVKSDWMVAFSFLLPEYGNPSYLQRFVRTRMDKVQTLLSCKITFTKLQHYKYSVFLNLYKQPTCSINRPLFQVSMQLLSKQLLFNIIIRHLNHMAICLDLHLGHFQANIKKNTIACGIFMLVD